MNSQRSSHTHCQAAQAQAQSNFCVRREQRQTCLTMPSKAKISVAKACQRVCLPKPRENFKIFFPLFKEKIKTRQRTTDPAKKYRNKSIDKFNMKVQFDRNLRRGKNRQCITRYIKNWADTTEIRGCGSLQSLYRFDSDVLRSAQLFIYRNRWQQV